VNHRPGDYLLTLAVFAQLEFVGPEIQDRQTVPVDDLTSMTTPVVVVRVTGGCWASGTAVSASTSGDRSAYFIATLLSNDGDSSCGGGGA
jgi:hypothetical protein